MDETRLGDKGSKGERGEQEREGNTQTLSECIRLTFFVARDSGDTQPPQKKSSKVRERDRSESLELQTKAL